MDRPNQDVSTPDVIPAVEGVNPESVNAFVAQAWTDLAVPIHCHEISGRHATIEMAVPRAGLRPGELISGPAQFAIADLALWCACFGVIGLEAMALTSELSIRFVRPATGSTLWARADLHSVGRRQLVGSITVWTDDQSRPVSVAQGTYVAPRPD